MKLIPTYLHTQYKDINFSYYKNVYELDNTHYALRSRGAFIEQEFNPEYHMFALKEFYTRLWNY